MSGQKNFSYEPERLADDLYAIPLPLYDGSPVNAYVAIGDDGLWLIDGGLGSEQAQSILKDGIESLGYRLQDIRGLLVTHGHNDHVGVADTVVAQGGQLLAHRLEVTDGRNINFDDSWLKHHGLPAEALGATDRWRPFSWPEPTRLLEDGDELRWGNLNLRVVWCPGHTPGLVCLFEPERGLLFTTDHVMRRAPAPVSVRNTGHDNPLREYLSSVAKLKPLAVQTVLPGHGRPFHHLRQRLEEIEADIAGQLAAVMERLKRGPSNAYELLDESALRDRRSIAARYQVSLVLARLRLLEREGRVNEVREGDDIQYALA